MKVRALKDEKLVSKTDPSRRALKYEPATIVVFHESKMQAPRICRTCTNQQCAKGG